MRQCLKGSNAQASEPFETKVDVGHPVRSCEERTLQTAHNCTFPWPCPVVEAWKEITLLATFILAVSRSIAYLNLAEKLRQRAKDDKCFVWFYTSTLQIRDALALPILMTCHCNTRCTWAQVRFVGVTSKKKQERQCLMKPCQRGRVTMSQMSAKLTLRGCIQSDRKTRGCSICVRFHQKDWRSRNKMK